jgi:hypothetical protein
MFIDIDIDSGKEEEENLEIKNKKSVLSLNSTNSKLKESKILIDSLAAAISNEKEEDEEYEEEEDEDEIINTCNNNDNELIKMQSTPITSSTSSIKKLKNEKIIDSLLGQIYNSSSLNSTTSSYLISDSDLYSNKTAHNEEYNHKFILNLKNKSNLLSIQKNTKLSLYISR